MRLNIPTMKIDDISCSHHLEETTRVGDDSLNLYSGFDNFVARINLAEIRVPSIDRAQLRKRLRDSGVDREEASDILDAIEDILTNSQAGLEVELFQAVKVAKAMIISRLVDASRHIVSEADRLISEKTIKGNRR